MCDSDLYSFIELSVWPEVSLLLALPRMVDNGNFGCCSHNTKTHSYGWSLRQLKILIKVTDHDFCGGSLSRDFWFWLSRHSIWISSELNGNEMEDIRYGFIWKFTIFRSVLSKQIFISGELSQDWIFSNGWTGKYSRATDTQMPI